MGATFSANDFAHFAAFAALVYVPFGGGSNSREAREHYKKHIRPHIALGPPGWFFGIAWLVVYGLVTGAFFDFARNHYQAGEAVTIALVVLMLTNLLFNKLWMPIFFGARLYMVAANVANLILITAIPVLVLLGVQRAWLAFGLYFGYVAWAAYAVFLSWSIVLMVPAKPQAPKARGLKRSNASW